ncbi:MAG: hypothetical protein WAJ99_22865, partial [Candidatus Sulfotelmatobacter sp.]
MSDNEYAVIGSSIFAIIGIVFHFLQEDNPMAMFRSLANAFKDFNNRIVRRSGFSSKVVVGFEVTGLLGFG